MWYTILYLIFCIITARMLDKKQMRVATVLYSVMFVLLLPLILFSIDIEAVRQALSNVMGEHAYLEVSSLFHDVLNSSGYGICIAIALVTSFVLQLVVSLFWAVETLVNYIKERSVYYLSKKKRVEIPCLARNIYISKRIYILYCRMLN